MIKETSHKSWGGAVAAVVTTGVAVLLPYAQGETINPDTVSDLRTAMIALATLGVNVLLGFLMVYYTPRNKRRVVK